VIESKSEFQQLLVTVDDSRFEKVSPNFLKLADGFEEIDPVKQGEKPWTTQRLRP
jgi:hypothetical protein